MKIVTNFKWLFHKFHIEVAAKFFFPLKYKWRFLLRLKKKIHASKKKKYYSQKNSLYSQHTHTHQIKSEVNLIKSFIPSSRESDDDDEKAENSSGGVEALIHFTF